MVTLYRLESKNQTGAEMRRLIEQYHGDLQLIKISSGGKTIPIVMLSLLDFFDFVRRIPYRRDSRPVEVVSRPIEIIRFKDIGMDCKKKSILICSYLRERFIPYRLIASSRLPSRRIHHVFPQALLFGKWFNMDATYRTFRPFEPKFVTKMEVI